MALVNCIECGYPVSDSAASCPKCGGRPLGFNCVMCQTLMKTSDSVSPRSNRPIHRECASAIFGQDGSCRECGATIWTAVRWREHLGELLTLGKEWRCTNCGALDPLTMQETTCVEHGCCDCGFPLLLRLHKIESTQHRFCYEKRTTPVGRVVEAAIPIGCLIAVVVVILAIVIKACG